MLTFLWPILKRGECRRRGSLWHVHRGDTQAGVRGRKWGTGDTDLLSLQPSVPGGTFQKHFCQKYTYIFFNFSLFDQANSRAPSFSLTLGLFIYLDASDRLYEPWPR